MIRRIVARLPESFQETLRGLLYAYRIRKGNFVTAEPEFESLHEFVNEGDWVIDVGANIGHYTLKLSQLVGETGRVISFEPIPTTFSHLARNVRYLDFENVTLINGAASSSTASVFMTVPNFATGMKNFYEASISEQRSRASRRILTFAIDSFRIAHKVQLIKIDAEGHEPEVIAGAVQLISRDRPTLILETTSNQIRDFLGPLGYEDEKLPGSPNTIFRVPNQ